MSFGKDHWTPGVIKKCLENYDELCEYIDAGAVGSCWGADMSSHGVCSSYLRKVQLILTRADFDRALAALDPRLQKVLLLRHRHHMSQRQIGRALRVDRSWVSRLIARGQAELEKSLCADAHFGVDSDLAYTGRP